MTDCSCHSHSGFLTAKGLEEAAQRSPEGLELAGVVATRYLDKVASVSGLRRDEIAMWPTDRILDEQHRRFFNEYLEEDRYI